MEQQYGYGFRDRLMRTNTDLHRCIPYDVRLKASIQFHNWKVMQ